MILEQLSNICLEIQKNEKEFSKQPYINENGELTAYAVSYKTFWENQIAIHLFNVVKKYALEK